MNCAVALCGDDGGFVGQGSAGYYGTGHNKEYFNLSVSRSHGDYYA